MDVWEDEIPGMVLDRLQRPRSHRIALRACFPRKEPNRLYCFDNDRDFSDYHTFERQARGTSTHYVLSSPSAT